MGIVKNQKKEIERKNQQIELLKHSIGGRDQEIEILRGQALAAQALIGAVIKKYGKLEIPLEEVRKNYRVKAKLDSETKMWLIESAEAYIAHRRLYRSRFYSQ